MTLPLDLAIHITCGAVGIGSGAVAMFARKGRPLHKTSGNVFFVAMLIMASTGAYIAQVHDVAKWTNTTASIFTLYLLATAWATVRRPPGRIGRFERFAVLVPLGLIGMGLVLAGSTIGTSRFGGFTAVFAFSAISIIAVAGDMNLIRRGGLTGAGRTTRHLWRMSASLFIATASFFFGQADVLPAAFRATFLPTLFGVAPLLLMAFWMLRVRLAQAAS